MVALGVFQALLNGVGWVLAKIYDVIPNYGIAIIVLTLVIRVVLLPLGIKQIKSMQHMQAIQPKIKDLQKKYKNNKQKQQEETMKLYKEAGVNPLGGCLPLLLQFPILIAMYSVIRAPIPNANYDPAAAPGSPESVQFVNNHLPVGSTLYEVVTQHQAANTSFLFMNLQCSLVQSGTQVEVMNTDKAAGTNPDTGKPIILDCGSSKWPDVVPYVLLLGVMIGTTFYQQIQMQKASPPGAQSQQQQAIMKVMPLMFAFFGLSFPAGLVMYWTVSNGFQIGQQTFLLRAGHIGPEALERRMEEQRQKLAAQADQPQKQGFMSKMMSLSEQAKEQKAQQAKPPPKGGPRKPTPGGGGSTPKKPPAPGKGPKPGNQLPKKKPPSTEDKT